MDARKVVNSILGSLKNFAGGGERGFLSRVQSRKKASWISAAWRGKEKKKKHLLENRNIILREKPQEEKGKNKSLGSPIKARKLTEDADHAMSQGE